MLFQPARGRASAQLEQLLQERQLGVELAVRVETGQAGVVGHHVQPQVFVAAGVELVFAQQARDETDGAHLADQAGVEGDLAQPVEDVHAARGRAGAKQRVDLDQQQVERTAVVDERKQRRVAGVATVPIRLAVDLHRLKDERQAGRGQQRVQAQFGAGEHPRLPGVHAGGGDEQRDLAVLHRLDHHMACQHIAQGVQVERVELVGAEGSEKRTHPLVARQMVEAERVGACAALRA